MATGNRSASITSASCRGWLLHPPHQPRHALAQESDRQGAIGAQGLYPARGLAIAELFKERHGVDGGADAELRKSRLVGAGLDFCQEPAPDAEPPEQGIDEHGGDARSTPVVAVEMPAGGAH